MLPKEQVSFKDIFKRWGKSFIKEFRDNILMQQAIDGEAFKPSKGSVGKISVGAKGKTKNKVVSIQGTHDRLNITGKLNKNAFKFSVDDKTLEVHVDKGIHSRNVSYNDIIYHNNKPTSANPKSPLVFPTTDSELALTKTLKNAEQEIKDHFDDFMKQYNINLKTEVRIG